MMGFFVFLIWRGFEIGRQAFAMERIFNGLVAQGVALWFGVQSFINIGVCLGLLPTKGLTLPMVSYGGSGIVMNCVAMALDRKSGVVGRSVSVRVDHGGRSVITKKKKEHQSGY